MATISDLRTRATDSNTGRPVIAKLGAAKTIGAATHTLNVSTNWTTITPIHYAIYTVTAAGIKDPTTQTDWKGLLTGTTISNPTLRGGTDRAYTTDAYVEITFTAGWAKDDYDWGAAHADANGALLPAAVAAAVASSSITTAKIADDAVTDAKLIYGKVRSRQGGDANDWSITGATTYDTSAIDTFTQVGSAPILAGGIETKLVTFPTAFNQPPVVICSPINSAGTTPSWYIQTITATNFVFRSNSNVASFTWIATGK